MSNEQYLIVSYFVALAAGTAAAILTAWLLAGPLRSALDAVILPLGRILRRAMPTWLILTVLLGFLSVSYVDCSHTTYQSVVADRAHMVRKTHEQGADMAQYLAVGLVVYALVLAVCLSAHARNARPGLPRRPDES